MCSIATKDHITFTQTVSGLITSGNGRVLFMNCIFLQEMDKFEDIVPFDDLVSLKVVSRVYGKSLSPKLLISLPPHSCEWLSL